MRYSIVVRDSATQSDSAKTALNFCKLLLEKGHEIYRVFFYQEGVHLANAFQQWPTDEQNIAAQWQEFIAQNKLDTVVCISAALKRGVINEEESGRYQKSGKNLYEDYELSGLGQLVEANVQADRVITF